MGFNFRHLRFKNKVGVIVSVFIEFTESTIYLLSSRTLSLIQEFHVDPIRIWYIYIYCCLLFNAARRPVKAWKPDLMLATEHLEPQVSHCKKYNLVSFCKIVSGDLHVWHVTYSSAK
jgi:hypothetical protein